LDTSALVKARSKYSRPDFRTVAAAALSSADAVLARWLPDGKREGHEYKARNPTRNDNRPDSFSINTNNGKWSDFATGDKGGDLVSLVAYLDGCKQGEAADTLGHFLGLPGARLATNEPGQPGQPGQPALARVSVVPAANTTTGTAGTKDAEHMAPVPDDAPTPPDSHPTRGRPSNVWTYRNEAERVLMGIYRFNKPDGDKDVIPLTLWRIAGADRWLWKAFPEPRPLYGLNRLAARPGAPVLICEGEKAADAAGELLPDFVAVTSPNGSKAARKAAWSPLAGRRALIWPDADESGAAYAAAVERLARNAGAVGVGRLDLAALADLRGEALPEGWDAADALAEGMDRAALERISAEALERMEAPPADDEADAAVVAAAEPEGERLPRFDVVEWREGWRNGVYWLGIERDKPTGEERPAPPIWICSPLRITASTRDERGNEWGRYLEWNDRDGRAHRWAMPCEMLAGSGEELRAALLRGGVEIASRLDDRRRLTDYISWARPSVTARAVTRTGWHGAAFVLPDRTIGDTEAEPIHYQAATAEGVRLGTAGKLERWRESVAAPCARNSRLVLALAAGFAAPCLCLLAATDGGFGVHYRGDSSTGKTTALLVAASIWGPPDFKRSWRATGNALEGVAALHSDLLLCLDEMGELSPKDAGATAYMLANGSGKGRANRDGSARAAARWRVLFLSTGEIGLSELIAEAGGRARAGQAVRVIDLPADAGAGLGLFEALPAGKTPGAFADELREAAEAHYGHAGPAFVARLVAEHAEAREWLRATRDAIAATLAPADAAGQVRRVAQHFALIAAAGELATEWGFTGWPAGEAEAAALACFQAWIGVRGTTGSAEPAAMLGQVRRFLESHGESRFAHWDGDPKDRPTINRAGFRKPTSDGSGFEYFVLPEAFKSELCLGFDHRSVARELVKAGALMTDSDGGATRRERLPGLSHARCYRILPAIWGKDDA
jgi:uncharacterized protein (DUF927 family)